MSYEPEECNHYIFGFGSIMNTTTHATWQNDKNGCMPGAVATIKKSFGFKREWNFRSATGFTALGVASAPEDESDYINGVLFQVLKEEMPNFDRREVGYEKLEVPLKFLELHPDSLGPTPQTKFCLRPCDRIWLYVPLRSQTMYADENYPLLQSYVDTVLQGCLEWGGESMAEEFIATTGGWSCFYLNDTPSSRRPWLFRKQYSTIDRLLSKHSRRTNYGDRRHPEEFALLGSSLDQRMKGTWSLPRRNPNFTGRERELAELQSRFSSQNVGNQRIVTKVQVAGMAGVGKSSLVSEYCYRHYPTEYGLIIWLNAETVDTLIADYRQLLADLANVDADTDELVGEVKTRLFRSHVPWLLVFDNVENNDWKRFVPNGAGMRGHVLATTRHMDIESGIESSGIFCLGCLDTMEAIELLGRSAGSHNMGGSTAAAEELSVRLGNLPLALSMAAAYMRQCDVQCSEYLERYTAKNGQSLLLQSRGKLQDYQLTVASSLALILPKIQEENQITAMVLHLLSYMGPDMITKQLFRRLLNAKANVDKSLSNKEPKGTKVEFSTKMSPLMLCGLILGGTLLAMPAIQRQRGGSVAVLTMATSILFLSKGLGFSHNNLDQTSEITGPMLKRTASVSDSFSAFEYEQSDLSWDILKSFSLLSVKEGKGSVHRLLQQVMRSSVDMKETLYYLKICVDALTLTWTFKPGEIDSWKDSLQILEHVKSVVAHSLGLEGFHQFDAHYTFKVSQLSKEAGVLSAMALNAFLEAETSLNVSLQLLDRNTMTNKPEFRKAKAETLYELSKVHRYQGQYNDAKRCLMESLNLNNADDRLTADALHELGILEVKQHNLDSASSFLRRSLEIRSRLDTNTDPINTDSAASSTLHQLAAIHVARKPSELEQAKSLLQEALSLSRQIGQRAATLKQLARVTIRQGYLDQAESFLGQALELYLELYGNNKLHINVAAVKFQQGALAMQRGHLDDSMACFSECLQIRRHVYAYAASSEETNPIHLEVACVLHELASVGFAQKRFPQSMEMLKAERIILEKLEETSTNERIYQAKLTNLTWSIKCAKEMGDDAKATLISNERMVLKRNTGEKSGDKQYLYSGSVTLQQKAMHCRLLARNFALQKNGCNSCELLDSLEELQGEIRISSQCPMKQAATQFRDSILLWINKTGRRSPILTACDDLRDVLRAHGVQVNDSVASKISIADKNEAQPR